MVWRCGGGDGVGRGEVSGGGGGWVERGMGEVWGDGSKLPVKHV